MVLVARNLDELAGVRVERMYHSMVLFSARFERKLFERLVE